MFVSIYELNVISNMGKSSTGKGATVKLKFEFIINAPYKQNPMEHEHQLLKGGLVSRQITSRQTLQREFFARGNLSVIEQ